jgi:hypothetical protein
MANNIEKLLAVFLEPIQDVENALAQLLTQRTLDTAVGAQLDVIGAIVAQPRGGLSDDDYRRYCRARIVVHRSNGVIEDVIRVAALIINDLTSGHIVVRSISNATFILEIRDHAVDAAVATALQDMLTKTVSAGVRIVVVYSAVPLSQTFRLDAGPGLDQGHLARGLDGTGSP